MTSPPLQSPKAAKLSQHRIDTVAGNENSNQNQRGSIRTPTPKIETLSVQQHHDRAKSDIPNPTACLSPANSVFSACSQSTALSRARNQIEGRRQSRAAARARIDAVLNDIEAQVTPKHIRDAVNEFSSRYNGSSSESESGEDVVLDEGRQPNAISLPNDQGDDEEVREENEEMTDDGAGQVITVENVSSPISMNSEKARSPKKKKRSSQRDDKPKKADPPADIDVPLDEVEELIEPPANAQSTPTVKDKSKKERKSKDRKQKQSHSSSKKSVKGEEPVITQSSFGLTEEALLAMSQAAFEVAQENEEAKEEDDMEQYTPVISPSSKSRSSASSKQKQSEAPVCSPSSKSRNSSSSSGPVDELSTASLKPKSRISSPSSSVNSSRASNQEIIMPLIDIQEEPTNEQIEDDECKEAGGVSKEKNDAKTPRSIVQTMSEASTQVHTHLFARGDYPTPRASNESPIPTDILKNKVESNADESAGFAMNKDTRSEGTSHEHVSFASSTSSTLQNEPTAEETEKKPIDIDKELGALDSMMFQQKGLVQLEVTTTGVTDNSNSKGSGNSSYSSENTRDLSPNKSMGPIWQKAIDDAQKVLTPTKASERKSTVLVNAEDETVEDNDTVVSLRRGFLKERMQYTASFGVMFLLMNSLFVILNSSSFAIRLFGLIGLLSAGFPSIIMCMFLMNSKTQRSLWAFSIKMLLVGCLCQVSTLILLILVLPLGPGAWAAGIVSSVSLLALTLEMNTNSPVSVKAGKEGETSISGDLTKCLAWLGLSPVDGPEPKPSRRGRKKKRKSKTLIENTTDDEETLVTMDTLQNRSSEYVPPDIGV